MVCTTSKGSDQPVNMHKWLDLQSDTYLICSQTHYQLRYAARYKASDQPAAYAQSYQNLCLSLEYSMSVKLLTEQHLEFLSLKGGCTGSPESTLVKMPHCWKSHVATQFHFICSLKSTINLPHAKFNKSS